MIPRKRKLRLSPDTLRTLTPTELLAVNGGETLEADTCTPETYSGGTHCGCSGGGCATDSCDGGCDSRGEQSCQGCETTDRCATNNTGPRCC